MAKFVHNDSWTEAQECDYRQSYSSGTGNCKQQCASWYSTHRGQVNFESAFSLFAVFTLKPLSALQLIVFHWLQEEQPIASLVALMQHLEGARFSTFWAAADNCRETLSKGAQKFSSLLKYLLLDVPQCLYCTTGEVVDCRSQVANYQPVCSLSIYYSAMCAINQLRQILYRTDDLGTHMLQTFSDFSILGWDCSLSHCSGMDS